LELRPKRPPTIPPDRGSATSAETFAHLPPDAGSAAWPATPSAMPSARYRRCFSGSACWTPGQAPRPAALGPVPPAIPASPGPLAFTDRVA